MNRQRPDGMVLRSTAIIALFALATCSTKSSTTTSCAGSCEEPTPLAITFSDNVTAGRHSPPVIFSRADETAIVDIRTFAGSIPGETTAWFPTPCHGVAIRSVRPGEVTLRSVGPASCLLAVTADQTSAAVGVRAR